MDVEEVKKTKVSRRRVNESKLRHDMMTQRGKERGSLFFFTVFFEGYLLLTSFRCGLIS